MVKKILSFIRKFLGLKEKSIPKKKVSRKWKKQIGNCRKKIQYRTFDKAFMSQSVLKSKGRPLEIYKCNICKRWHLTSKKH